MFLRAQLNSTPQDQTVAIVSDASYGCPSMIHSDMYGLGTTFNCTQKVMVKQFVGLPIIPIKHLSQPIIKVQELLIYLSIDAFPILRFTTFTDLLA